MVVRPQYPGYSLLEVILALAILGGSIAALGEATRWALRNARAARDLTIAQSLCESKMSEIVANLVPLESAQGAAVPAKQDEPAWLYRVDTRSLEQEGLVSVCVTVSQDLPTSKHPATYSLVRWLADPDVASPGSSNQGEDRSGDTTTTSGQENAR